MEKEQKMQLGRIALAGVLLIIAWGLPTKGILRLFTFLVPYCIAGIDVLKEAGENILHGEVFDEDFLMAVATIGAFAIGEYPEAVFVMIFFLLGEFFEDLAEERTRESVTALMDIRPDYVWLETEDGTEKAEPAAVAVGSVIQVRPGEKIPLDGVILEGSSALDTKALTGESAPRDVQAGEKVLSGCVNLTGLLRIRTETEFAQSTVSKILELVENAAESKSKSEKFITKFARWYTPAVVIAALCIGLVPPIFVGNWAVWVKKALIFLVISCPCALVISVPLTFFGGVGGASRCGVLVKGSSFLDELAKAKTVIFDKTGTLTKGSFTVTAVHAADGDGQAHLELAALAECRSGHPAAKAIVQTAGVETDEGRVTDLKEIPGHGVEATVDGKKVFVGSARLMERHGITVPETDGGTVVYAAEEGKYLGCIVLDDTVKDDAAEAILKLKALGVKKTVMLTGDREESAARAAQAVGVDDYHAGLLPGDKVEMAEQYLREMAGNGSVLFVGDGVNDAPVLARADVGIAMGGIGSDAAVAAADVVLMDDSPEKIAEAIVIARRTRRIAKENIAFALTVKVLVLLLGTVGLASMWAAVMADVGVMVLAVLNASRAMKMGTDIFEKMWYTKEKRAEVTD